jgi:hypothetical protein
MSNDAKIAFCEKCRQIHSPLAACAGFTKRELTILDDLLASKDFNYIRALRDFLNWRKKDDLEITDMTIVGEMVNYSLWLNEHAAEHRVQRIGATPPRWLKRIQNKIIGLWWYLTARANR